LDSELFYRLGLIDHACRALRASKGQCRVALNDHAAQAHDLGFQVFYSGCLLCHPCTATRLGRAVFCQQHPVFLF